MIFLTIKDKLQPLRKDFLAGQRVSEIELDAE